MAEGYRGDLLRGRDARNKDLSRLRYLAKQAGVSSGQELREKVHKTKSALGLSPSQGVNPVRDFSEFD